MAALRRVEWSARAERDLDRLYAFVLERWTEREADHLLDMVQEFEALVARWPNGFKRSQRNPRYTAAQRGSRLAPTEPGP